MRNELQTTRNKTSGSNHNCQRTEPFQVHFVRIMNTEYVQYVLCVYSRDWEKIADLK